MRYSAILVSALLLSSIYVITSNSPALAEEENLVVEAADEIGAASGSNRFVVWSDRTPGINEIFLRRSTDNGATWKAVVNLSNSAGGSSHPQMAVSGSNVYVVWDDNTPGNFDVFMRRSTDNGATWNAAVNLSNNAGNSHDPQIAVSGSNVHVVWPDRTSGSGGILFRLSTDKGATWNAAVRLGPNVNGSFDPQIAVLGPNVYVVWQDVLQDRYDIFFRRSTDNGATWKSPLNLSNNAGTSERPQIAVSGSSFTIHVYVVWNDSTSGLPGNFETFIKRSTDKGATWNAAVNLSNSVLPSFGPQIAVAGPNVYVTWFDSPGKYDLFFRRSTDNGVTWKAVVNLSNNPGFSDLPQIAVSGSNVYVVWNDKTPGNDEIFIKHSTDKGATWNAVQKVAVNLSNNAGDSVSPQIAVFSSNVHVVWTDNTCPPIRCTVQDDILFIRSTDNGATWQPVTNLSMNSGNSVSPQVAG